MKKGTDKDLSKKTRGGRDFELSLRSLADHSSYWKKKKKRGDWGL